MAHFPGQGWHTFEAIATIRGLCIGASGSSSRRERLRLARKCGNSSTGVFAGLIRRWQRRLEYNTHQGLTNNHSFL